MVPLTEQQFQDFQKLLDWEMATPLPDGRVLGSTRRTAVIEPDNFRVKALVERYAPADKTILELGTCEGYFTVQLAPVCKHLTAVEVRPKNLLATLTRAYLHGIKNLDLRLMDVRQLDAGFGRFDILFHAGVFYHLDDPVEHLFRVRSLAPRLLLDTHYVPSGDPRFPRADIDYGGKTYEAYEWKELGWDDVWSGVQPTSRMLSLESLMELLHDTGFGQIEVLTNRDLAFAPRIVLIAESRPVTDRTRAVTEDALKATVARLEGELKRARDEVRSLRRGRVEVVRPLARLVKRAFATLWGI